MTKRLPTPEEDEFEALSGFDQMMSEKRYSIKLIKQRLRENPRVTRRELARWLQVSMRTITRYLAVIRKERRLAKRRRRERRAKRLAMTVRQAHHEKEEA